MNKFYLFFVAISIALSFSCTKEKVQSKKTKVKLTLDFKKFKKALTTANAAKVALTLKKGNAVLLDKKILDVKENSGVFSIELELENADYSIEELVIGTSGLDATGGSYPKYTNANFFVPKKADKQLTAVAKPLPQEFTVSSGTFSSGVSLVVISVNDVAAPTTPSVTGEVGITEGEAFTYGFKTTEGVANKVEDVVIKVERTPQGGAKSTILYNVAPYKKSDGYSYFMLRKLANVTYDFEISKFGYASKKAGQLTSTAASANTMVKVSLVKLTGVANDVYVKNVTTGDGNDGNIQRGGGDFGSLAYWDELPVASADAGLFHIDKGLVSSGMTKITSNYEIPAGDYDVTFKLYEKGANAATANSEFNIGINNKVIYYQKGGTGTGTGTTANGLALGTVTTDITKSVTSVAKGKIYFEVSTADKGKIFFSIEEIKKK